MDRKQIGQQRLGTPLMATFEALVDTIDQKGWHDFNRGPVGYYFTKMLGHWLLHLMDKSLTDEQLQLVSPEDVRVATLLLLRDMFRQNPDLLRPGIRSDSWVEPLFMEVVIKLAVSVDRFDDDGQPYELEDTSNCGWAESIAKPFGIIPQKLFACHSAIIEGVRSEFGKV